jgi:hypothetical protein
MMTGRRRSTTPNRAGTSKASLVPRRAILLGLISVIGLVTIPAGPASAAPLSCTVRHLQEVATSRGLDGVVALSAAGDGAVAWTPSARSNGALRIRPLVGAVLAGHDAGLSSAGRLNGLQIVMQRAGEASLIAQRVGAALPQAVVAATFDGRSISPPTTLSRTHASLPDTSVGPDGTARAVWIETSPFVGSTVVTATRVPGGDWSAAAEVAVVAPPETIDGVQVIAGRAGRATIAWRSRFTGITALSLGPGGAALGAPVTVRSGTDRVGRPAVGGSPSGITIAWTETGAAAVTRLAAVHLSPNGDVGSVRVVSRAVTTTRNVWITSGPSRFGLVAWAERGAGKLRVRTARLDTRDGSLRAWIAPVAVSETGVAVAAAAGGRGAVTWRALVNGRRVIRIASGLLNRPRPADHATIAGAPRGPGAPSLALSRGGRVALASVDAVPPFRYALRLASCTPTRSDDR